MNRRSQAHTAFSLFSFQDIITSVTGVIMLVTLLLALKLSTQVITDTSASRTDDTEALSEAIQQAEESIVELRAYLAEHSTLDEDIGNYTSQSAARELSAATEELRLLIAKAADLKQEQVDITNQVGAADHKWQEQSEDIESLETAIEELAAAQRELTELSNSQRVFYNQSDEGGRQVYVVELFDSDILVAPAGVKEVPRRFSGQAKETTFADWAKSMPPATVRFVIIVHPGTTDQFREVQADLKGRGFKIGYDLLPSDKIAVDPNQGAG